MKYLMILILFAISLCVAIEFPCQLYDEKSKCVEKYCANFKPSVPENFSINLNSTKSYFVSQLKVGGCDNVTLLDTLKQFKRIHYLDISYSDYETLDWLNLKLGHLRTFNASHNKIENFVWTLLKNTPLITEIDLSHNNLKSIYKENSTKLNKLVKIHLSNNYLRFIGHDTFAESVDLEFIDLSDNLLRSVPNFSNNNRLKVIHLENNQIQSIDCCVYSHMKYVSIYFQWSTVETFVKGDECPGTQLKPFGVVQGNNTEGILMTSDGHYEIHCNTNSFQNLVNLTTGPNSFENISHLLHYFGSSVKILDLAGNIVGNLNSTIFQRFDHLIELDLSRTKLTDFDFGMLTTRRLAKVDMSHNDLKYVNNPSMLQNLPITKLDATGNHIENAAEIIQHLRRSIEELDLSGNLVGKLNATTFDKFTVLKILKLSNTNLSIDDINPFEQLKNLRILNISHNNLKNVNFTQFSTILNRLTEFDASYCQIENASDLVEYLGPNLTTLNLSGNVFGRLTTFTFQALNSLDFLYMSNASISLFYFSSLRYPTKLQTLDISENKLKIADLELLPNHLSAIHLNGNEITEINNLNRSNISIAMSKNRLSCMELRAFMSDHMDLKYIDDPLDQKHGHECRSSAQGISDFLDSVYDKVKFW